MHPAGMIWSVSMLSFKTKQRPWKVVSASVSLVSAAARGIMVVGDVPRGVREIEEGMKETEPLFLRKEDRKGAKEGEGLIDEEGKAWGKGREDAIVFLLCRVSERELTMRRLI